MHVIVARNVNDALPGGVRFLREHGVQRDSRNGPVLVAPSPVTTVYTNPRERVLFSPKRDANPFFHLVESLWMLAGRDDLATLTKYVANMKNFSDDGGVTQPGAYGKRWRNHFLTNDDNRDQLSWAIRRLKADHSDRRVVVQMYDADVDQDAADRGGKDIPCNIVCAPWVDAAGRLSMTIFCRSNDIIWGAYGANAVHFSFLQEYLAAGVGVPLGTMYQVSNNYHAYLSTIEKGDGGDHANFYVEDRVLPHVLFSSDPMSDATTKQFDEDLTFFFDEPSAVGFRSVFLRRVAAPVVLAHQAYRKKTDPERFSTALEIIEQCAAEDWKVACAQWLHRRKIATTEKENEG